MKWGIYMVIELLPWMLIKTINLKELYKFIQEIKYV